jgi:peptide deformylase
MILPIVKFPDKVLRKPAERVKFPLDKETLKLVRDMLDTVKQADGIGLAAPQVGKSLRLVVIDLEKNGVPPFVLFNPKVVSKSFKRTEIEEGCLSLPEIWAMVKRPVKVTVQAQDMTGKKMKFTDDGWIARVVQHEIDHTDGILLFDRTKKFTKGEEIVKEWKKQKIIR